MSKIIINFDESFLDDYSYRRIYIRLTNRINNNINQLIGNPREPLIISTNSSSIFFKNLPIEIQIYSDEFVVQYTINNYPHNELYLYLIKNQYGSYKIVNFDNYHSVRENSGYSGYLEEEVDTRLPEKTINDCPKHIQPVEDPFSGNELVAGGILVIVAVLVIIIGIIQFRQTKSFYI